MLLSDCLFVSWCYFPASGLRWREQGMLYAVGTEGNSWSAAAFGYTNIRGTYLYFYSDSVTPLYCTYRAHSFPVRCVQELA